MILTRTVSNIFPFLSFFFFYSEISTNKRMNTIVTLQRAKRRTTERNAGNDPLCIDDVFHASDRYKHQWSFAKQTNNQAELFIYRLRVSLPPFRWNTRPIVRCNCRVRYPLDVSNFPSISYASRCNVRNGTNRCRMARSLLFQSSLK